MKIARVFIQEYPGRQVGDIHDVFSPDNHPGSVLSGIIQECEVADDFDSSIMKGVIAEDGSITFEQDAAKVAAKAAAQKQKDIEDRYNDMNTEVFAEMAEVFGTNRADSATAFHQTWELMKAKPALFYQQGLKVTVAHGSFQVGDDLDTMQKIEDYADAALAAVETYAVWRMNRIKQFHEERAAILAG